MAQGTRGRWLRVAATGFGVMLCTGLVGCMGWDKPKELKGTKQPEKYLPGTPKLDGPAAGAGVGANKAMQPGFGGPGGNIQPGGAFAPTAGSGAGQPRYGTSGINTNTSGVQPIDYRQQPPGTPGGISAPVQPGVMAPQFGPPGSAQPNTNWNSGASPAGGASAGSPPVDPLPPLPPPDPFGPTKGEPTGAVLPPLPPAGGPPPVGADKKPVISTGPGVFGDGR